ncbi:MAG: hypothetical protein H0T51_17975 [Pirellulales bacterium]|nr:hypothetical protein [Pirellulales bacterium]
MLRTWIEAVIERLFRRMLSVVEAKLDARMAVELAVTHAELLKEAERYRAEFGEASGGINHRLESLAAGMGDEEGPLPPLLPSPAVKKTARNKDIGSDPKKRGRGRPRKAPQAALPFDPREVQP